MKLIQIDDWINPQKSKEMFTIVLNENNFDILCVPKGYVNSIQALEEDSKLLAMSDYLLGEIKDEYRFDSNYFIKP